MQIPRNTFLDALRAGRTQLGFWLGYTDPNVAESLAACGYDWLLIDGEHAPNDVRQVLQQLRAVAPYPVHPIVRPVQADVALVKQLTDIGAMTLLVPMIDTAEQAERMAQAMRYPPEGIRGVGTALARASRWNQVEGYIAAANAQMCLLVQAETTTALGNLAEICAVPGVDGVFFGPADLAASMGLPGQSGHPQVLQAMLDGFRQVREAGKAAGGIAPDPATARRLLDGGASFVAVGLDTSMLVQAARERLKLFRP